MVYTTGQWVLLFFFYCLCGWVWESCYVSVRQRHWVNRGFLQGPLLPIYGSGAVIILLATIPVASDLRLVWLFGMIAATILEYVTGAVMERLFRVRYWDYSNQRFNLNGHICLSSSIAWGFFSILMVRVIHPPVARLLIKIPTLLVDPLAHALTVVFTIDVVRSVQAALDLRDMLARITEENEELRHIARKIEITAAFAGDDLRRFREKTELEALFLRVRMEEELDQRRRKIRERVESNLERLNGAKLDALETFAGALETCREHLDGLPAGEQDRAARKEELDALIQKVRRRQENLRNPSAAPYHRALRILRANPSAAAREFSEAIKNLRRLGGKD